MKDYQIIENFLTPEKCQELIDLSEAKGYEEADISYTTGAKMNKEYRDNSRCLYESESLRQELEKNIMPYVPATTPWIKPGGIVEQLKFLKLSGKFRFYKYQPGQKFKKHRDGSLLEEGGLSVYTVLIYLNSAEEGGETGVYDYSLPDKLLVKAETGKCLIFNHTVAHTGEELKKGVKYVLRTDFIYEVPNTSEETKDVKVLICNNCKEYWFAPKEKCTCGSTTLTETDPSNAVLVKNK